MLARDSETVTSSATGSEVERVVPNALPNLAKRPRQLSRTTEANPATAQIAAAENRADPETAALDRACGTQNA